ncbi:MAG: M55 family metallopeptidase [Anaerolineales bacterium]|jgi:D-amino peptidase
MKILIAADMEGVSGVVHWDQVDPEHAEYVRFRRVMTGDVNAAIQGAFEAGASEVIVSDGHAYGRNLLIEELDPRVRLNSGSPAPLAMIQGIEEDVNGVMFVGYHARAGTPNAILDHTWSSRSVANLWLGDILVGESGLNAAFCGYFNVPVIMVSGDQTVCSEAIELLGPLEVAVVKRASGRMAADCLPPTLAQREIHAAAVRAVKRLASGEAPAPFVLPVPVKVTVEFYQSEMADNASLLPGIQRTAGRRIEFMAENIHIAYNGFRAAVSLARG